MFSKLLLTAALSLLAFAATADEVPASTAVTTEAPAQAASAPTAASAPAASPVAATSTPSSLVGGLGRWVGSVAKSAVNVTKNFADGVKQGYSKEQPSTTSIATAQSRVESQATSTATAAAASNDEGKTDTLASRLRDLQSKLLLNAVGRQAPAPVETRVVTPVASTETTQ